MVSFGITNKIRSTNQLAVENQQGGWYAAGSVAGFFTSVLLNPSAAWAKGATWGKGAAGAYQGFGTVYGTLESGGNILSGNGTGWDVLNLLPLAGALKGIKGAKGASPSKILDNSIDSSQAHSRQIAIAVSDDIWENYRSPIWQVNKENLTTTRSRSGEWADDLPDNITAKEWIEDYFSPLDHPNQGHYLALDELEGGSGRGMTGHGYLDKSGLQDKNDLSSLERIMPDRTSLSIYTGDNKRLDDWIGRIIEKGDDKEIEMLGWFLISTTDGKNDNIKRIREMLKE